MIIFLFLDLNALDHTYTYKGKTYKSNRLDKETLQRMQTIRLDRFTHKGKEYIASRECEEGRSISFSSQGFLKTIKLLGYGGLFSRI